MRLQRLQQISLVPPFDNGEGIQLDDTASELFEQCLRCCSGFYEVFACLDTMCVAGQARVQAKPEIVVDYLRLNELPGDGGE